MGEWISFSNNMKILGLVSRLLSCCRLLCLCRLQAEPPAEPLGDALLPVRALRDMWVGNDSSAAHGSSHQQTGKDEHYVFDNVLSSKCRHVGKMFPERSREENGSLAEH